MFGLHPDSGSDLSEPTSFGSQYEMDSSVTGQSHARAKTSDRVIPHETAGRPRVVSIDSRCYHSPNQTDRR